MKIPCLSIKIDNKNYIIRDLEVNSKSLDLESIVGSIIKDNNLNVFLQKQEKEVVVEIPVNKDIFINTLNKSENLLNTINEDNKDKYTIIANNLIGNANLRHVRDVLKFNGSNESYTIVNNFINLFNNFNIVKKEDNFIKIDDSDLNEINLYIGNKRNFLHIPKKLLTNTTKLNQALSYLYVDLSIKNNKSEIYKTLNTFVNDFLNLDLINKENYDEFLYNIQNDFLTLNIETRLKKFLYYLQNEKFINSLDVFLPSLNYLNILSDIVSKHYNIIKETIPLEKREGSIEMLSLTSFPILNYIKDTVNNNVEINNTPYYITDLLELTHYFSNISLRLKQNYINFINNNPNNSSKIDLELNSYIKSAYKTNLSSLSDSQIIEGMKNFITEKTKLFDGDGIQIELLDSYSNKYDLYKIINNLELIYNIYKEEQFNTKDLSLTNFKTISSLNNIIESIHKNIIQKGDLKNLPSKGAFIPQANINLDENLVATQKKIIKFSPEYKKGLSKYLELKIVTSGLKSALKTKDENTLIINLKEAKSPEFYQKILPEIFKKFQTNKSFYISDDSYKILDESILKVIENILETLKNNPEINKKLTKFFITKIDKNTINLLDLFDSYDIELEALISNKNEGKESNDRFIKNIQKLNIPTSNFSTNIIYKPFEQSFLEISKRVKEKNALLLTPKNSYIYDNYLNKNKPIILEQYGQSKNTLQISFDQNKESINFFPKYYSYKFDINDLENITGTVVNYKNNKYVAFYDLTEDGKIIITLQNEKEDPIILSYDNKSLDKITEDLFFMGKAEEINLIQSGIKKLMALGNIYYTDFGVIHVSGKLNQILEKDVLRNYFSDKLNLVSESTGINLKTLILNYFNNLESFLNLEAIPVKQQNNIRELIEKTELIPDNFQTDHSIRKIVNILNKKNNNIKILNQEDLISLFNNLNIPDFDTSTLQNKKALIHNNIIYINSSFLQKNPQTLFHEMSHIIISELKSSREGYNKFEELVNITRSNINNELLKKYQDSYKGFTNNDLYEEITADLLGDYFSRSLNNIPSLESKFNETDFKTIFVNLLQGNLQNLGQKSIHDLLANNLFNILSDVEANNIFLVNNNSLENTLIEQRQLITYKKDKMLENNLIEDCK